MSDVVALGHDEQSLAAHAVPGFARAENSRRNAVAQSLQWWDDGVELLGSVPRHVLAEDKIRPAGVGDADDFGGKEPLSTGTSALSGNAVVLAGVARSDAMNDATPRSSVEGGKVRPDRCRMKPPAFHRRDQACGGCGFPLHVSDSARVGSGKSDAKLKPADTGAQREDVEASRKLGGT